jgi:hypothetical protein
VAAEDASWGMAEGAVDDLEARRIDDLNMKMLDLLDRAKEPAYKKNPAALAGLKKQFQKIKSERDSYFKINPATGMNADQTLGTVKGALDELGIPGNVPTEKIPGKEDLLKGKGRSYYEDQKNEVAESEVDSDGHSVDHADSGEYDYEGDQAKDQLNTIVRAARRLNGMLDDNENMPEWVQMKITNAADYIDTAADYIESNQEPDLAEGNKKPEQPEADYGDDYQDMVKRLKQLAGAGPLKTVYDPAKRVYRNVPVAVQPKK